MTKLAPSQNRQQKVLQLGSLVNKMKDMGHNCNYRNNLVVFVNLNWVHK